MKSFIENIADEDDEMPNMAEMTVPELMVLVKSTQDDISNTINQALECDDFDEFQECMNMLRVEIFACREYQVALNEKPLYKEMQEEFDRFREKMQGEEE